MYASTRLRRLVEMQGYCGLTNSAVEQIDPWLRVAPAFCAGWTLAATIRQAPGAIAILSGIAALGAVLPLHPFDLPYNLVIRHWTGTPPIPSSPVPRRFACSVAALWLAATYAAFTTGRTSLAVALGLSLTAVALVPVTTGFCVPSWVLSLFRSPVPAAPPIPGHHEQSINRR